MLGESLDEDVNCLRVIVVHNDALPNAFACVEHCGMIAAAEALPDLIEGEIGQLPAEVNGDLTGPGDLRAATGRDEVGDRKRKRICHGFDDLLR